MNTCTITDKVKKKLEYNGNLLLMTKHKHATPLHRAATKIQHTTRNDRATLTCLGGEQ